MTDRRPSLLLIASLWVRLKAKRAKLHILCWIAGTTVAEIQRIKRLRNLPGGCGP